MKALILLPLFALMQNISAAEPLKCPGTPSCASAKQVTAKGAVRMDPYRQAPAPAYSDEPLPPAPGMKAWKPKTPYVQKDEKVQRPQSYVRVEKFPATEETAIHTQQTSATDIEEFSRM